ncbi:MAG TPA: protein kinase, partial [Anaerolineales bacterium]|nr:protein kinase [Anaerolineales bacterium]
MPFQNRYRMEAEIGRGGMGIVYRAQDTLLEREVAVKVLNDPGLGNEARARLLREAQAAARLNHPNIVSVYDAGEWDGSPFIVMELVEGVALSPKTPRNIPEILSIAAQVCSALRHAHNHDIVHRDLKPENVLITADGQAKLMDFGLARSVAASRLTVEGIIIGTVYYLAPEQALGQEVDGRADLYALGVMLYELTTGRLPFTADDSLAVISQHLNAPVVPPRAYNENIPPSLDALIVRLMSKRAEDRPASAQDVSSMLEHLSSVAEEAGEIHELILLDRIVRGRLVGRERELSEANAYWQRAVAGKGQVLLISGEPGIGKTRFVRELTTRVEISGGRAVRGECYEQGGAPYAPVAQIIRTVLGDSHSLELPGAVMADLLVLAPDLRQAHPDFLPNPPLDPESEQQRLFENVVEFCNQLARRAPLMIFVDDAHWADSGTLSLLRHLARRLRSQGVMIVITYREVELDEARPLHELLLDLNRERLASRLKLQRLSKDETRDLLTAMFAEEITSDFLDGIYFETEGNPFFIEEVCKALVENGKLYFSDGRWHRPDMEELEIPQSVRLAIQARVGKLPAECQEVLALAAILGREFDFDILAMANELDEDLLIDALERAERAQLIQEMRDKVTITYAFVHALIPATLYDGVSMPRRRRLHRKVGETLAALRPEEYEALAHHFTAAGERGKAAGYHHHAARRAASLFAFDVTIRHLNLALNLIDAGEQEETRLALLEELSDAHQWLGEGSEAIPIYQEALESWRGLAGADQAIAVRLHRKIGEAVLAITWFEDRQRFASDSWASLEAGLALTIGKPPHPETVRLLSTLSRYAWLVQFPVDWDAAERYARVAVDLAEQLGEPVELSAALGALASVLGGRGLFRERVQVSLRRLELTHDPRFGNLHERANILLETGKALVHIGEFNQAIPYFIEAESLSSQIQAVD